MLDKLYRRLYTIFIGAVMLIITLIIVIVGINYVKTEQVNDSTYFQRMSTLLIYQLEDEAGNMESTIKSYEDSYGILVLLKDAGGAVVYQGDISFPTKTATLFKRFYKQAQTQEAIRLETNTSTTQGGLFAVKGRSHDNYWGMPVKISAKDGSGYDLTLLYKQKTIAEILSSQLFLYLLIWGTALVGVALVSRLVLKKAMNPTERVLQSQKEFIASASHELKSPLAVLLANVDTIHDCGVKDMQIQKAVHTMSAECLRMSGLVRDMQLLAVADAKTWTLNKGRVNVDTLLITLYEAYEPLCRKEKLTLHMDISNTSFPVLDTDEERMFQLLSIYMDNAIQHAGNNTGIEIKTALREKGMPYHTADAVCLPAGNVLRGARMSITFYIVDHGKGVAEKDKPFVFDRFYCGDKSHTDKSHSGLGLSIAAELAKLLNAKIGLADTKDGGVTFFVTVPVK